MISLARLLLRAAALSAAASSWRAAASWTHAQRDASRDNSASVPLPDAATGARASSPRAAAPPDLAPSGPLLHSRAGVVIGVAPCGVTLFAASLSGPPAAWRACGRGGAPGGGAGGVAGAALWDAPDGAYADVVLVVTGGDGGGAQVWGLAAASASATGAPAAVAWGPTALPGGARPAGEPLVLPGGVRSAVVLAADGRVFLVDPASGALTPAAARGALCGAGDAFSQPPVLLRIPGATAAFPLGSVLVVSDAGCAAAFDALGGALWAAPAPPPGFAAVGGGPLGAPPAADALDGVAFFAGVAGGLCCVSDFGGGGGGGGGGGAAGGACAGWPPGGCVAVNATPAQAPLSPLAVSPPSPDFRGGQVYALGADGTLFAVQRASGAVAASLSPLGGPACAGAPVLFPGAWGAGNNGLLLLAPPGAPGAPARALAVSVGNNGAAEANDTPTDDDGAANAGVVWAVDLPPACAAPGALPPRAGLSVSDAGRALAPCAAALAAVDAAGDAGPYVGSDEFERLVIGAVVAAAALALGGVARVAAARRAAAAADARAAAGAAAATRAAAAAVRAADDDAEPTHDDAGKAAGGGAAGDYVAL